MFGVAGMVIVPLESMIGWYWEERSLAVDVEKVVSVFNLACGFV